MRAPDFWQLSYPTLKARVLEPFGLIYGAICAGRMAKTPRYRSTLPVICIGNLTAGGAGKTPTALAVLGLIRPATSSPVFLTRGHGGSAGKDRAHRVDPNSDTVAEVGDEALVLAQHAPVIVSHDRAKGAKRAETEGASAILMDDGFQNPTLNKDVSIIVVDAGFGIGNGQCIPSGPLRAPLENQLKHADIVLILNPARKTDQHASLPLIREAARTTGTPVHDATVETIAKGPFAGKRLLAFAGIGRPDKFFASLRGLLADVRETLSFPDHHPFTAQDAQHILDVCDKKWLTPVTTTKDVSRLTGDPALEALRVKLIVFDAAVRFAQPEALRTLIAKKTGLG